VSWLTAQEFCLRAGAIVGRPLRLPSEAEWEYACRAGTTTRFAFGDQITPDQANFNGEYMEGEVKGVKRGRTTPVDHFKPNAWGLYDMHGNVQEWCEDAYGSASRRERGREAFRVLRGGSFSHGPGPCESSARAQYRADAGDPEGHDEDEQEPTEEAHDPIHAMLRDFFSPTGLRVALSTV
jgi:formylglycine-generating enzyme required for sulfatase activity